MCALRKAPENKSEHSTVCQHLEPGLQTFLLLLGSVFLGPAMLASLVWASGKLQEVV